MGKVNKNSEGVNKVEEKKQQIQQEFKKEEVTLYYDKYSDLTKTYGAMDVAVDDGVVVGNTVVNRKRMMQLEWIMKAVELAKDKIATNEKYTKQDKLDILDHYYYKVINDVAVNWARY
jgi:hypothetical protein